MGCLWVMGGSRLAKAELELIESLSDDDLLTEANDLDQVVGRLGSQIHTLRVRKGVLKDELQRRGVKHRKVSEHAVLRFLERIASVDTGNIRNIIRRMASRAVPTHIKDHYWDKTTGTMLIIGDDGQVITILSPTQAKAWLGMKLADGSRVHRTLEQKEASLHDHDLR